MPALTYVGDDEQYFPDLGRWVAPGDLVEDAPADDPRFVTATKKHHPKSPAVPANTEES